LGDDDAGSTTGLDVHDVGTAGVAACDAPGLGVKEAEVGEAAERLGDGVLAEVERGAEVADVRLDGEPVWSGLGSEGKFLEEHPGQRPDPAAQGPRGRQDGDRLERHGDSTTGPAGWKRGSWPEARRPRRRRIGVTFDPLATFATPAAWTPSADV